jgi:uncharacterized protein (TIGR03435 family)
MLQHLLEERFHIKMHRETRQMAGYNLQVDNGGPKLADHDPEDRLMMPIQPGPGGSRQGKNLSMQYLAFYLSQELGQTVVDQTGLKGQYDFNVKWGYDGPMMAMPAQPGSPDAADLPVAPPPWSPRLRSPAQAARPPLRQGEGSHTKNRHRSHRET